MAQLFNGAPPGLQTRRRWSRKRWIIAGGAALAAVAAIVVAVVLIIPPPPPPPAPMVPAGQSDSLLLAADQIDSIMGASNMQSTGSPKHKTETSPANLSVPDCVGALFGGQDSVYGGSGYSGISAQAVQEPGDNPDHVVIQNAVTFPSTALATTFVENSAAKWKSCAGQVVTDTSNGNTYRWSFGQVTGAAPKIAQLDTQEGQGGWGCQHALSTASNVVADVVACGYHITDEGSRVADKIIANAMG